MSVALSNPAVAAEPGDTLNGPDAGKGGRPCPGVTNRACTSRNPEQSPKPSWGRRTWTATVRRLPLQAFSGNVVTDGVVSDPRMGRFLFPQGGGPSWSSS